MKSTALLLLLAAFASAAETPTAKLQGVPAPDPKAWPEEVIAVLIEHNPWAMVIGADTPRAEIFTDGTIIRLAPPEKGTRQRLLISKLTPDELRRVKTSLMPAAGFWDLKDAYDVAPNVTDLVTTELIVSIGERFKRIEVYGYAPEDWKPPAFTVMPRKEGGADPLPAEFDRLCRLLAELKPEHEVEWSSRYVEVMIWPYEHSPDKPLEWPGKWPGLTSPMAFPRGDSYSLILPGSELSALQAFVAKRGERQAVLIGGKKWSIDYRPVMPGGRWAHDIAERQRTPAAH